MPLKFNGPYWALVPNVTVNPLRSFEDIPSDRESVGAMAVAAGTQMPSPVNTFKPYVYRGTGKDQFPETHPVVLKKVERPEQPKRRDCSMCQMVGMNNCPEHRSQVDQLLLKERVRREAKASEFVALNSEQVKEARRRSREQLRAAEKREEYRRQQEWLELLEDRKQARLKREAEQEAEKAARQHRIDTVRTVMRKRHLHPADGWKPTTGEDIEALLAELGDG